MMTNESRLSWVYVGDYFRDDICSQNWSMFIARDSAGHFHVLIEGEEFAEACVGDGVMLIGFFEDYGIEALADLGKAIKSIQDSEIPSKMIDKRVAYAKDGLKTV